MLRFGTDGIRGDAEADLTSKLVVALGRAAAVVFGVRVIDQTRTPMPITAISPTATMVRIPNFAGTRSGCGLLGAGLYGGTGP